MLQEKGIVCNAKYMSRDRLERIIDRSIVEQLTDRKFLTRVVEDHLERRHIVPTGSLLESQAADLKRKEQRLNDAYFDGHISATDWKARLRKIQQQREAMRALQPQRQPLFHPEQILSLVAVFSEWPLLGLANKRALLARLLPEIQVYKYEIQGAKILLPPDHDSANLSKRGASPLLAHIRKADAFFLLPFEWRAISAGNRLENLDEL